MVNWRCNLANGFVFGCHIAVKDAVNWNFHSLNGILIISVIILYWINRCIVFYRIHVYIWRHLILKLDVFGI